MSRPVRRAVLLLNLGSPDGPDRASVRRYLAEFLADGRVLDLAWPVRQFVLRAAILPFRPARSARAWAAIWGPAGSPLLAHSRAQAEGIAARLGLPVHLAMRYGRPSLADAVAAIAAEGAEEVAVAPLYPQYSGAATGSALEAVYRAFGALGYVPALQVLRPFWDDPGVNEAWAARVEEALAGQEVDALVASFHGLPERQVRALDPSGACLRTADCCEAPDRLARCYRAQCLDSARRLGERLGRSVIVAFQSRLGRDPWLGPHTEALYDQLPAQGARRIAVVCPSFVADNLETLEEVAIRGRARFLAAGGEALIAVPCLNDHPLFLDALARRIGARLSPEGAL